MKKKWYLLLPLLLMGSCVSVNDAGRSYFSQGSKVKGVEPADAFVERMNREKELRVIMYGQTKAAQIISCTLLRNQFYVAAMKTSNQEIIKATKTLEEGFQQDDDTFLSACDQVLSTTLGKEFLSIQQQYLAIAK